jgi:hypothetical protein
VYKLKIEILYNKLLSEEIRQKRICCSDTVGVAHTTESSGGFERSTSLNMDNVDAVIIADDSKLNMDNNTGVILRHIASRVDYKKIFFAMTFFDNFTKQEFDEDEDLDEQKIEYLSRIHRERVSEYMEGSEDSKLLNERHLTGKNTFYLKGLAQNTAPDISAINGMLKVIQQETEIARSPLGVSFNKDKSIVTYDYRKLSLHYTKARTNFLALQNDIYMGVERPHFKTTEALTRRLSKKVPEFIGAKKLIPVDDFFDALIRELKEYISNPETHTLDGEPDKIAQVISMIKTVITERIKELSRTKFFSDVYVEVWTDLYNLRGIGTDTVRREGIIAAEERIAPTEMEFLIQKGRHHIIDELEDIFEESVEQIKNELLEAIESK